jgi:hypothetical protein
MSQRWRNASPVFRVLLLFLLILLLLLLCVLVFLQFVLPIIRPTPAPTTLTPVPTTQTPTTPGPTTETPTITPTNTPVVSTETVTATEVATGTITLTPVRPTTTVTPILTPTGTLTPVVAIANVLRNGNFEEGFQPNELGKFWGSFNNGDAKYSFHIDDWPLVVVEGKHTQLIEIKEASRPDRYLGIRQTATVIPGQVYTFSMRGLIRTNVGDVQKTSFGYRLQVGFDLNGGQNWEDVTKWVELPWDEQQRVQGSFRFDAYTATLTAKTERLTVFIRAWKKWADSGEGDYDVDDIRLVGPALVSPPAPGIPVTGEAPPSIWDNVRVWATIALLLLLLGGAIWRFGWKRA